MVSGAVGNGLVGDEARHFSAHNLLLKNSHKRLIPIKKFKILSSSKQAHNHHQQSDNVYFLQKVQKNLSLLGYLLGWV